MKKIITILLFGLLFFLESKSQPMGYSAGGSTVWPVYSFRRVGLPAPDTALQIRDSSIINNRSHIYFLKSGARVSGLPVGGKIAFIDPVTFELKYTPLDSLRIPTASYGLIQSTGASRNFSIDPSVVMETPRALDSIANMKGMIATKLSISNYSWSTLPGAPVIPAQFTLVPGTNIGITGSYPTQTITNTAPVPTITGAGSASVSGSFPLYTITVPGQTMQPIPPTTLAINNNSLSTVGGNTITLPSPTLTLNSNTLSAGGNSVVLPTYYQSLSISGSSLSISTGNTVVLPAAASPTITGSNGISVNTSGINYTVSLTKRQETYSGITSGSGTYTVNFATSYSIAPNIQANIVGGLDIWTSKSVVSASGFTVTARGMQSVLSLGVLPTYSNVPNANIDVLITEK